MIAFDREIPEDLLTFLEVSKNADASPEFSVFEKLLHPELVYSTSPGGIYRGIDEVRRHYKPLWLKSKDINDINYEEPVWLTINGNNATFLQDFSWRQNTNGKLNLTASSLNVVVRDPNWRLLSCFTHSYPVNNA